MSASQRIMLFGLWKRAKAVLMRGRETWTKHEEDQRRHALTIDALGEEKSWSDLSNADVDKVKGALLAIIQPGDLNAQLRQLNQRVYRMRHKVRQLAEECAPGNWRGYVDGIVEKMNRGGAIGSIDFDDLNEDQVEKVLIALRKHEDHGPTVAQSKVPNSSHLEPVACVHAHTSEEPF